jgi:hypothetical protein
MSDLNSYEEGLAVDLARAQARIKELEADLRKMALDYLAAEGQAAEAYQAQLAAEHKLTKAVKALEAGIVCTTKHGGAAEFLRIARTTLAELKGETDD